jgi:hypothetical protein
MLESQPDIHRLKEMSMRALTSAELTAVSGGNCTLYEINGNADEWVNDGANVDFYNSQGQLDHVMWCYNGGWLRFDC